MSITTIATSSLPRPLDGAVRQSIKRSRFITIIITMIILTISPLLLVQMSLLA